MGGGGINVSIAKNERIYKQVIEFVMYLAFPCYFIDIEQELAIYALRWLN